ncbi:uncharacterized protein LOC113303313 [Papaver somniferum]|uniref:uncharacterized protein LOC113303313 n=1 Tax=Papaver somniferum TaxID=3469 RepID=UPI000E6FDCD6|nr:uncharacterized protein LOC113303313 [Papaver somniferum]
MGKSCDFISWWKIKTCYINGKISRPSDDKKLEEWISQDHLVMTWLLNSMEPTISNVFNFSESSKDMWDSVAELYGNQNNAARIFQLQHEIAAATQGDKPFIEHYGNLKRMWDELAIYRLHTIDPKVLLKRPEEDKIFSLLHSLKPEYKALKSHVLMNSTVPSLSSICATIQREENRKEVIDFKIAPVREESSALAVERGKSYGNRNKGQGKREIYRCDHCNKTGHTKDRCWQLHPHLKPMFDSNKKKEQKEQAAVADTSITLSQLNHILQQYSKSTKNSSEDPSTNASGSNDEEIDW